MRSPRGERGNRLVTWWMVWDSVLWGMGIAVFVMFFAVMIKEKSRMRD